MTGCRLPTAALVAASLVTATLLPTAPALADSSGSREPLTATATRAASTHATFARTGHWVGRMVPRAFFGGHVSSGPGPSGLGAVRLWDTGTTWRSIHTGPGIFDFTTTDALVDEAGRRGQDVLLVLGTTPAWAAADQTPWDASWLGPGSAAAPVSMEVWRDYVTEVMRRYRGRIQAYQVWNEPTLPMFWRGGWPLLARMTRVAHEAAHRIDPSAMVVAGPVLPRQAQWRTAAWGLLAALRDEGWPVDAFAVHSYPRDLTGPGARVTVLLATQRLLTDLRAPRLPLWDTEANYVNTPNAPVRVSPRLGAVLLSRTYLDSLRTGVSRTFWYRFGDVPERLRVADSPTLRTALQRTSDWVSGHRFLGCSDTRVRAATVTRCRLRGPGRTPSVILWSDRRAWVRTPSWASHADTLVGSSSILRSGRLAVREAPIRLRRG